MTKRINKNLDVAKIKSCTQYFLRTMRHKWFVFVECCRLGIPWLGIIHDWTKFTPGELWARGIGYGIRHDYPDVSRWFVDALYEARLHHQHRNKHHWERWIFIENGKSVPIEMPDKYRREMLAEWRGVSREKDVDIIDWYARNRHKIQLHPETRTWLEQKLAEGMSCQNNHS